MTKDRSSNFELLRIILIVFVIAVHYNDGIFSIINNATITNKLFLFNMRAFTICAVNTFVCLSGYFLYKKEEINVRKIVHLFTILFAYRCFSNIPSIIHNGFSVSTFISTFLPNDYYANLYSVVFLISPFLNLITRKKTDHQYGLFMTMLIILFAIIPTISDYILPTFFSINKPSISTISLYGNGRGFTLINFILCYYMGGFIARKKIFTLRKPLIIFVLSTILVFIMMIINRKAASSYCNVFVILQAGSLIAIFKNINFQNRIINNIANSVWGIFCIHGLFLGFYKKLYPYCLEANTITLTLHFFACIIFVFMSSLLWDKACSIFIKPIERKIDNIKIFNKKITTNTEEKHSLKSI